MRIHPSGLRLKLGGGLFDSLLLASVSWCLLACHSSTASNANDSSLGSKCAPCPVCAVLGAPSSDAALVPATDGGRELASPPSQNASPPLAEKIQAEPLSATPEQWLEFLTRAANYRGKEVDRAVWENALKSRSAPSDTAATGWGKLCNKLGFATDEALRPLCTIDTDWSLTLDVADMEGDGHPEYWLFGTWVTLDHHDGLLAVFAQKGEGLRPVRLPPYPNPRASRGA